MTRPTGVIYSRPASEGRDGLRDGVHVETCGWNAYIVMVTDAMRGQNCMIVIHRRDAAKLVKEWMQHIDTMDEMDALEAEAEAEAGE